MCVYVFHKLGKTYIFKYTDGIECIGILHKKTKSNQSKTTQSDLLLADTALCTLEGFSLALNHSRKENKIPRI